MSGAGVELGRAVVRVVALAVGAAVVELGREARETGGFFSGAAPAVVLLEAGGLVVRGRVAALLVVVEVLRGAGLERAASETTDVRLA